MFSANPYSTQRDKRSGQNGTYGTGCGWGSPCSITP